MRQSRNSFFVFLFLLVFVPASSFAQAGTGIISGLVKDTSGATIPGLNVRVVNEATSEAVEVLTDDQGLYRATALVPGAYRIEAALYGFETVVRRVALEVGQTSVIDVT